MATSKPLRVFDLYTAMIDTVAQQPARAGLSIRVLDRNGNFLGSIGEVGFDEDGSMILYTIKYDPKAWRPCADCLTPITCEEGERDSCP